MGWLRNLHNSKGSQVVSTPGQIFGAKFRYYKEAASLVANRLYTNIKTFSGGVKAWKEAGYPVAKKDPLPPFDVETIDKGTFKKNFNQYCILDIRIRKHYAMGLYTKHLNDEMNALSSEERKKFIRKIPLPHLTRLCKKVPFERPVVVVDYKGKQAPLAVRYLQKIGHAEVYMLKGGLMSFEN